MTNKRNKTLKKGGAYYDYLERRDNRMSRDGFYLKNTRFNNEALTAYKAKYPDANIDEKDDKFICSKCNSAQLNIFNLLRFFDIVRTEPNMSLQSILNQIKGDPKKMKKCKNDTTFCKDNELDEKKLNLCYLCNKKYIQEIYRDLSIDVIPTLYVPNVSSKWLKDVDFEQIDQIYKQQDRRQTTRMKTLYLYIRFKSYNSQDIQWGQGNDVYTINLNNSERDKNSVNENGEKADESDKCHYGFISSPCTLNDLLNAHFNNIATIILNSYMAGTNIGQGVNKVYYDKLMYYCDVDENILISTRDNVTPEDKNYYEDIKTKVREFLNVKKLNKIINDKLKTYYQIPLPNVSIFKRKSIKKPDIFVNLESYKEKMTEKEYKNLETVMKKLEENGLFERQRRLQERKSKSFHTITINTLNINHEDNIDDKNIVIRNYSPLNSFQELSGKDQVIYFTPEIMLYKSDLTNPKLYDTSRKLEDKHLIEIFLDPNKLARLLENIPKTPDRYTPLCKDLKKDEKCDINELVETIKDNDSKQRGIIVNNINLILDLLFDDKPINLNLSSSTLNNDISSEGLKKKKHFINRYIWNSSEENISDDISSDVISKFTFNKKESDDYSSISNYKNACVIEPTYEKDRFVLKCYLDINLELIAGEDPDEFKKIKRTCLTRKQKIIKLLKEVFNLKDLDDEYDGKPTKTEGMLESLFREFGINLLDMLKDTNESKRRKRTTKRFLKNIN